MTSKGAEKMTDTTIGVDISKDTLDVYRHPDNDHRQFSNDPRGFRTFIAWLGKRPVARIVFEATGAYHRAFETAMQQAGLPLSKLNPRHVKWFRQAVGELAKTDRIDAALLARFGVTLEPRITPAPSQLMCDLKELHGARLALIKQRTAVKNRIKTLSLPLLRRQAAQRLKLIERQLAEIEAELIERIQSDPQLAQRFAILNSIPGIAKAAAFVLIIEMPELGTLDKKAAASLSGTAPRICQSGQRKGTAFVHGGRSMVRQALYMPALVAARFNSDMKAMYDRLTGAGKPPKVAITAVMRKLVVLANALLRDNRMWVKHPA